MAIFSPVNKPFPTASEFKFDFKLTILVKLSIKVFSLSAFLAARNRCRCQSLWRRMAGSKIQTLWNGNVLWTKIDKRCAKWFLDYSSQSFKQMMSCKEGLWIIWPNSKFGFYTKSGIGKAEPFFSFYAPLLMLSNLHASLFCE